jgi:uncharacterized protein YbjT (DUF2867 family)
MSQKSSSNHKPIPRSVLIFGAAAHIGGPLARFLRREAPDIRLRLVSSDPDRQEDLGKEFPEAEVVSANYFDPASLEKAVAGMEGIFVITPGTIDERTAMTNLVNAVRKADCVVQILRCVGMQPEANLRRLPESMKQAVWLPSQHPIVKQVLDESDLPVTYLNFGATFMDNLRLMLGPLHHERKLVWHNRLVPWIDPREIAEVAGRLLLSDNHRHIGQFHTLNNGQDLLRFSDVAELMTEVFGEKITHDGSREAFFDCYPMIGDMRHLLWDFFEYERDNEVVWALNDFVERTLGRKPVSVREWLREHKQMLMAPETDPLPPTAKTTSGKTDGPVSVEGVWDCIVKTPVGKQQQELTIFSASGGVLTGEAKDVRSGDVLPLLDGKIDGNVLTWSAAMTKPFKMTLKVQVQVQGSEFTGQAKAGMLGSSAFTGVKRN